MQIAALSNRNVQVAFWAGATIASMYLPISIPLRAALFGATGFITAHRIAEPMLPLRPRTWTQLSAGAAVSGLGWGLCAAFRSGPFWATLIALRITYPELF